MNIKQDFRIIFFNKTYSILNILGLAVGITFAVLILLWVENEVKFNRTFSKSDRIYQLGQNQKYGDDIRTFFVSSNPIALSLATEFPGVNSIFRYQGKTTSLFKKENDTDAFYEAGAYADSSFFSMLDVELLKGNLHTLFDHSRPLVISEKMAAKFFAKEDPIGKVLQVDNGDLYQVTGVFKSLPENSSFDVQWILPFRILFEKYGYDLEQAWGQNWFCCYVELAPDANVEAINKRLHGLLKEKGKGDSNTELFIYPNSKLHLYGNFEDGKPTGEGYIRVVKLFFITAMIILLIACINFMNLSTARSEKRAMEVGVRKTFGAKHFTLVMQFMKESAIITFLSLFLSLFLVWLLLPYFNLLINSNLSVDILKWDHQLAFWGIGLFCTFFAGSYPSFYLSSFNPIVTLKKMKSAAGSAVWIRKGLIVFQFTISFVLICATIIIFQQIRYAQNRPMGFNKEHVISIEATDQIKRNYQVIKNELVQTGFVENAALSSQGILTIYNNGGGYNWQGKDSNVDPLVSFVTISENLFETLDLKLIAGRDFYEQDTLDNKVIINENLAKLMGEEGRVGGILERSGSKVEIIGIVNDFVFNDIYNMKGEPVVFARLTENAAHLFVRLKSNDNPSESLSRVEAVIKGFNAEYPFVYTFMEDNFDNMFKREKQQGILAVLFSALAIFISCLGLFGLSAFSAEQRTKEIGIRKVLGANVIQLTGLLVKSFLGLICISFVIGLPIAWLYIHQWLKNYAYHVDLSWMLFVGVILLISFIALLTVGFQSVKAARANPVKSIKVE